MLSIEHWYSKEFENVCKQRSACTKTLANKSIYLFYWIKEAVLNGIWGPWVSIVVTKSELLVMQWQGLCLSHKRKIWFDLVTAIIYRKVVEVYFTTQGRNVWKSLKTISTLLSLMATWPSTKKWRDNWILYDLPDDGWYWFAECHHMWYCSVNVSGS